MAPVPIADPADPRVADYVGVRDGPNDEVAIVEGLNALGELLRSDFVVRSVLCLTKRADRVAALLADHGSDAPLLVADEAVLRATVGFDLHRGVIAAAERRPLPTPHEVAGGANRLAVLEGIGDLENLGSLFRNAAALGIDGVLLDPTTADPLYRRAIRVSSGQSLRVPFARYPATTWPGGLDDLRAAGFTVIALTPAADAVDLRTLATEPPARVAFLLGAEGPGLTDAAAQAADLRVRIPISPDVDSLNVATAAAIAFFALGPRA